ncbi:unnamed protein product [Caenorhabditis auriculariae]|uniref:Uncharacterized protein n=1 Tax=Caenorhabditis auriculariae TaxID=2777116 RepID=A0A8S1HNQ5_9PELO|nr:unnamed protein product [Caenorhabditis auriculariae]
MHARFLIILFFILVTGASSFDFIDKNRLTEVLKLKKSDEGCTKNDLFNYELQPLCHTMLQPWIYGLFVFTAFSCLIYMLVCCLKSCCCACCC